MITPIHFEVFASGMKARLDPTYRRDIQGQQHPRCAEIQKNHAQGDKKTVLPFTTILKSYRTYAWK